MSCWCRWAQFRQSIEEIDAKVKALVNNESVSYRQHIGGGHYVSVTSGFRCVDFRKWFIPYGQTEIRPTRSGIALRLSEWAEIQKLVETINTAYPTLGTALPCYLEDDHQNQIGALRCRECYPFLTELLVVEIFFPAVTLECSHNNASINRHS